MSRFLRKLLIKKIKKQSTLTGFVLLEVILSLTILGLGLTLILGSFITGLKALGISRDYTKATFLLTQKIGELEERAQELYPTKIEGVFEEEPKFTWKVEIKRVSTIDLKEIRVIVEWEKGKIDLMTYL